MHLQMQVRFSRILDLRLFFRFLTGSRHWLIACNNIQMLLIVEELLQVIINFLKLSIT